jgi:hypothetical protein
MAALVINVLDHRGAVRLSLLTPRPSSLPVGPNQALIDQLE